MACERVIGVDRDGLVRDCGHHELRHLAVGAAALQRHPGLGLQVVRQYAAVDFLHQLLMPLPVGIAGLDADALAVADRHSFDGLVETGNDLAAADLEF